jgi:hypothetical protein
MIQSDRPGGEQTRRWGWSQRTQKLEIAEFNPQRASSSRDFLCRIWYLCWNLTGEVVARKALGGAGVQKSDEARERFAEALQLYQQVC